jgi:AcrR family transcriptional regulator
MRPQRGKQKLFDAAMHLFESKGYFSTTVEQITERAGVSKGLVYNYFSSKEELLAGLIEDATTKMASVAGALEPGESLEDSLALFIDRYFQLLKTKRRFLKLQLTLMLMPELSDIVLEPQRQRASLLLAMLSKWFKQAAAPHPKAKARIFLAMLDGVALHYLCIYERYPLRSMRPQLIEAATDLCTTS